MCLSPGAGSNFGPVTSFTFRAFPQTNPVWSGMVGHLGALTIVPGVDSCASSSSFTHLPSWRRSSKRRVHGLRVRVKTRAHSSSWPARHRMSRYHIHIVATHCCESSLPSNAADARRGPILQRVLRGSQKEVLRFLRCRARRRHDPGDALSGPQHPPGTRLCELRLPPFPRLTRVGGGAQNPMTTHGDRKIFKATVVTSFEHARFQQLFDAYAALTVELPETAECVASSPILCVAPC